MWYNTSGDIMNLKDLRQSLGITVKEASETCGVALRTYFRYEQDENYGNFLKREGIKNLLKEEYEVTEDKGLLTMDYIRKTVFDILEKSKQHIDYCYLFGSYAKKRQRPSSDVDLCVSTSLTGFEIVELINELEKSLHKKVDFVRLSEARNNEILLKEIMRDGIKIYG